MTNHMHNLLTVEELSEYLHVPVDTLYAWKYKGYGPTPRKVGRHLRYLSTDVERWLERQTSPSVKSTTETAGGGR